MNKYFFVVLWFTFSSSAFAQYFQSGQDPAFIHWKQLNSVHFQILFPSDFQEEANRFANTLEYVYAQVSKTLNHQPKKISIVLHSRSSYSNGFVTWAPKRMELFTTPSQDNYAQDWMDQLALHELRHVVQIDKLNQGITGVLRIAFGEQATGAVSAYLPRWFLEGDAVAAETSLSNTGRGRSAAFNMEMKALVTGKDKLFSYEKVLLGSYHDYIPNHYYLGYPFVSWIRNKYGSDIFQKSLNTVGKYPFPVFPFPLALKKETGLPLRRLYATAFSDLKVQWTSEMTLCSPDSGSAWVKLHKNSYTSYRFPHFINENTVFTSKSGIDQNTEFVLIDKTGSEHKIHMPGYFNDDKISVVADKFVWAEEIPDLRWQNQSFYCIKIGNAKNGNVKTLTSHTRYFSPSLSPDGTKIAAIEISLKNEYSLAILDASTGNLVKKIASPDNLFLQFPEWIDEQSIVMLNLQKKGKAIVHYQLRSQAWEELLPPTFHDLGYPVVVPGFVLFTADFNGTNNLFALSRTDRQVYKLTNSQLGAFDPSLSFDGKTLLYSEYSPDGYSLKTKPFDISKLKAGIDTIDHSPKLYQGIAKQENFSLQDSTVPMQQYKVKSYSPLLHSLNIHSWTPFYFDYDNLSLDYTAIKPGIAITSQDKLDKCVGSAGYAYEGINSFVKAKLTYQALYPVFELSTTYGGPVLLYSGPQSVTKPELKNNKLDLNVRTYLPLSFTRGIYTKGLTPSIEMDYKNSWFYYSDPNAYQQGMTFVSYYLYGYMYQRPSTRDLAPKWGITASAKYYSSPFDQTQFGRLYYFRSRVYLPGIITHHSLQIMTAIQKNEPIRYVITRQIDFPRGTSYLSSYLKTNPLLVTNELKMATFDYAFPIAYPDLDLGAIFYLKRLRGNVFYDVASNYYKSYSYAGKSYTGKTETLSCTGLDLTADFHLFRILFPINAGLRITYFPNSREYSPEFLFRMDLTNY